MIRGILRNGVIHPLDPLPADWSEGTELEVQESPHVVDSLEELEQWHREMEALTAVLNDPIEWEQIERTLADADREAKEWVRREMGLP